MATHLIAYIGRPTIDQRVIRSMRFDRSPVPIVRPPTSTATIGEHLGLADHFRIAADTGAVTCRTDLDVADDMVLCPDLGVTEPPQPELILWQDAPLEVFIVHGVLLGLSMLPREGNWSWAD